MNLYEFSNEELVRRYTLMVQADYYDPHETPEEVVTMRDYFRTADLERVILQRMACSGPIEVDE